MKKTVFLLALMSCFLFLKAQEYVPFPASGAKWTTAGSEGVLSNIYYGPRFVYSIGNNDTLIDGKTYHILYCNDHYCCGIREDIKRVFANFPEQGEHLIYDFNLQVGDTVFYNLGSYGSLYQYGDGFGFEELPIVHYKVVESIDNIQIKSGEIRKRWKLKTKVYFGEEWMAGADNYWIEGIGDPTWIGLFNPFICGRFLNDDQFDMTCISQDNVVIYQSSLIGTRCADCSCRLPVLDGISKITKDNFILFPNPFTDKCSVYFPDAILHTIAVFDYTGKKVEEISGIHAFETEIKLSGHPSGIYFIQVTTALGVVTQKIIKQ